MINHNWQNSALGYHIYSTTYYGYSMDMHFHANCHFVYIIKGKFSLYVDGMTRQMNEGDFAFVMPMQIHQFTCENEDTVYWHTVFSETYVQEFIRNLNYINRSKFVFPIDEETKNYLFKHLIGKEVNSKSIKEDSHEFLKFKACLCAAASSFFDYAAEASEAGGNYALARKFLDYISLNYTDISLKKMAADLGYTPNYVSSQFSKLLNTTFQEFLGKYRIEMAKNEMTQNPKIPISELAFHCGFNSVRNFNIAFKKNTKRTPGEYLKTLYK